MSNNLNEEVKKLISTKLNIELEKLTDEASFSRDLGADSLDQVELIMEFEKKFNISIPDDHAEKITTVGEALRYIQEQMK